VRVAYCRTGEILGDYFTKALQGVVFRRFCDRILNIAHASTFKNDAPQECLEEMKTIRPILKRGESGAVSNDGWTVVTRPHSKVKKATFRLS
jgi:hypothetical protein